MTYLELVVDRVRSRLIRMGGQEAWEALEALRRLSPQELDVLAKREAQ